MASLDPFGEDLVEVVVPSEDPPKYGLYKPQPDITGPLTGWSWETKDAVEVYGFVTNQGG